MVLKSKQYKISKYFSKQLVIHDDICNALKKHILEFPLVLSPKTFSFKVLIKFSLNLVII